MKLVVYKETKVRIPQTKLKKIFQLISEEETEPGSSCRVNLILTTDSKIKELNRNYRNKEKATDVLSFNIDTPDITNGTFGEIYISSATAKKQAKEYGASLAEELLRLFCHGLLHLFGYEHKTDWQETIMKKKEDYFLTLVSS